MRHLVKSLVLCLILSVAAGTSLSILTNYTFFDDNINQITFWCIILLFVAIWLAFLGEVLDEFRPAIKAFFARQAKPAAKKPPKPKPAVDAAKEAPKAAAPKKEEKRSKDPQLEPAQPKPSAGESLKAGAVHLFNKLSPLLFTQKDGEEAETQAPVAEPAKTSSTLDWNAAFEPTNASWGDAFESESDEEAGEPSAESDSSSAERSEYADLAKAAPEQPSEEPSFQPLPSEPAQEPEQTPAEEPVLEQLSFQEQAEEAPAEKAEEAVEPEAEEASVEADQPEQAVEAAQEPAALPEAEQAPEADREPVMESSLNDEPEAEEQTKPAEAEAPASDEWQKSGPDIPSTKPYATPQAKQSRELQEKRLQHLHAEVDKIIAQQQQKEMTEDNLRMLHKLEELQKEIDIRLGPVD